MPAVTKAPRQLQRSVAVSRAKVKKVKKGLFGPPVNPTRTLMVTMSMPWMTTSTQSRGGCSSEPRATAAA